MNRSGPEVFFSYARPPNERGYCGPDDSEIVGALASGLTIPQDELSAVALAFQGAWPYLELIARHSRRDPLDRAVVETYWIGSPLLDVVDSSRWGHAVHDRFSPRSGHRWGRIEEAINDGGRPTHAFHVFCVYPWVGLLKEGHVGPSLEVLDQCRISMGRVHTAGTSHALVERRPLIWHDDRLCLAEPQVESCAVPAGMTLSDGDAVSVHWSNVCQILTKSQSDQLGRVHDVHLAIANRELTAARLEPSRPN